VYPPLSTHSDCAAATADVCFELFPRRNVANNLVVLDVFSQRQGPHVCLKWKPFHEDAKEFLIIDGQGFE
jgi:hypothetical protein